MRKLLLFFLMTAQVSAQELTVKKGTVVDSLKVSDSLSETFALYLPTNFKTDKTWPVLVVLDGEGRGRTAAQLYRPAAEEQGYIIISSNNISEENSLSENLEVTKRLIGSSEKLFPLDVKMISVAGSMGGGRVASVIPLMYKGTFGVIAVGDHWVNEDSFDKDKNVVFIGVAGDEQYTFEGIKFTAQLFKSYKRPSYVYTFEGDHAWPKNGVIRSVLGSLTIEAMKNGLRPIDRNLITSLYNADISHANTLISAVKLLEAMDFLTLMEYKYDGLMELDEIETKQKQMERSRNYERQQEEYGEIRQKEIRLMEDFSYYLAADVQTANFENLGWWNYQKIQLDSLVAKNQLEGKMAKRLIGFIESRAKNMSEELEAEHASINKKLISYLIQTIYDPQNFKAYKKIISLSTQDNDFNTALFYLEEMLKHGYKDKEALYAIEGTLGLRLTPEFNAIVENYLGTSKYYTN